MIVNDFDDFVDDVTMWKMFCWWLYCWQRQCAHVFDDSDNCDKMTSMSTVAVMTTMITMIIAMTTLTITKEAQQQQDATLTTTTRTARTTWFRMLWTTRMITIMTTMMMILTEIENDCEWMERKWRYE